MSSSITDSGIHVLLDTLSLGLPVSITAPVIIGDTAFIGYYFQSQELPRCTCLPVSDISIYSRKLYVPIHGMIKTHGLKRIWEALGIVSPAPNLNPIHDTKLMAYLLDPDSGNKGLTLASAAWKYLGEDYPYRILDIYEKGYPEAVYKALAYDAALIWRLSDHLYSKMTKALQRVYQFVELPLMSVLCEMHRRGIGIDGGAGAKELSRVQAEITALSAEITQGQDVNLASDRQVFHFLIKQGVRFAPTDYAARRVNRRVLEETAHKYPIVEQVLRWSDLAQELGFLKSAANQSRVHPVWGQTRSGTSRIYARKPAVQNIGRRLRSLFVPAEGNVFVKADYKQAQLRILAHLSEDQTLISLFSNGRDPHDETASALGIDRDTGKQVNFGICFGISAAGLAGRLSTLQGRSVSINKAQGYIDGFYARFPKVKQFFEDAWNDLKALPNKQRVVTAPSGRIRRFSTRANKAAERRFRITLPQQMEADLIKTAMVRLDRIFKKRNMKAHIVMVIHDALWIECPHNEAQQVKHLVEKMMQTAGKLKVPLEVDLT